jgi:hypothetical protein
MNLNSLEIDKQQRRKPYDNARIAEPETEPHNFSGARVRYRTTQAPNLTLNNVVIFSLFSLACYLYNVAGISCSELELQKNYTDSQRWSLF